MIKIRIFTMACFGVVAAVLWLVFRSPNCRMDGALMLKVGDAEYLVHAWMDPSPSFVRELPGLEKSSFFQQKDGFASWCQSTSVSALQVSGFGFSTRPRRERSEHPFSTSRILRISQLSAAVRPSGNQLDWRNIRSVTYKHRTVSADRKWATIFFALNFASGPSKRLEARCMYGGHVMDGLNEKEYVKRCATYVSIGHGNALEINVNPRNNPPAIGQELIQSLRSVEIMTRQKQVRPLSITFRSFSS